MQNTKIMPELDNFKITWHSNKFMKILIALGATIEQLKDYHWEIEELAPHRYHAIGSHPVAARIDLTNNKHIIV